MRPTWAKSWLVRLHKVGLTQTLLKAGFTCRAVWPYQTLVADLGSELLMDREEGDPNLADPTIKARQHHTRQTRDAVVLRVPLNPTSDLWRQLMQAKFPFIKRELLRDNPTHVPDVAEWRDVVTAQAATNLGAIEDAGQTRRLLALFAARRQEAVGEDVDLRAVRGLDQARRQSAGCSC